MQYNNYNSVMITAAGFSLLELLIYVSLSVPLCALIIFAINIATTQLQQQQQIVSTLLHGQTAITMLRRAIQEIGCCDCLPLSRTLGVPAIEIVQGGREIVLRGGVMPSGARQEVVGSVVAVENTHAFAAGQSILISDCEGAEVARIRAVKPKQQILLLQHDLQRSYASNAIVARFREVHWTIGRDTQHETVTALTRRQDAAGAEAMVPGITALHAEWRTPSCVALSFVAVSSSSTASQRYAQRFATSVCVEI